MTPAGQHAGRATLLVLVGAAGCLSVIAAVLAVTKESSEASVESLAAEVVEAGAPGVLLLVRDDGSTHTTVRGDADRERGRPVRAADRFRVGSVTKTFVATVVLQLVAEGRLRLDDTVEKWLPDLVPDGRRITVRRLLAHTSGLYDYVDDPRVFAPYAQRPTYSWSPRRLVAIAVAHPPAFPPGRGYAYSSTNYLLLGLIVESATRVSLAQELRARVFEPLRLRHTTFSPRLVSGPYIHGHRAPSHQGVVTGPPRDTSREAATWTWAAGAIVSSAEDIRGFFAALLGGKLVPARLLEQMETLVPAGNLRYGLGLAAFPTPCGDAWGHTGNAQGTITVAWNRRDASRQVVLVVNTYPLSGQLEAAVRRLQIAAFCDEG